VFPTCLWQPITTLSDYGLLKEEVKKEWLLKTKRGFDKCDICEQDLGFIAILKTLIYTDLDKQIINAYSSVNRYINN
jgi:hypothetical protein